jgi:hypothetical protein
VINLLSRIRSLLFVSHYAAFGRGDRQFMAWERRWLIGVLLLVVFTPITSALPAQPQDAVAWLEWGVVGAFMLAGFWNLGFTRRSFFDRDDGIFDYRTSLLVLPLAHTRGQLADIEEVTLHTTGVGGEAGVVLYAVLAIRHRGRRLVISRHGPAAKRQEARHLATLIRCPLRLSGQQSPD